MAVQCLRLLKRPSFGRNESAKRRLATGGVLLIHASGWGVAAVVLRLALSALARALR